MRLLVDRHVLMGQADVPRDYGGEDCARSCNCSFEGVVGSLFERIVLYCHFCDPNCTHTDLYIQRILN